MRELNRRISRLEHKVADDSKYYYYPPADESLPLADKIAYAQEQQIKADKLGKIARPFGYVEERNDDYENA